MAGTKDGRPIKPGHGVPNIPERGLGIFTDGSMLSNPGRRGGYAFSLVYEDPEGNEVIEDCPGGGYSRATNNQMEIKACTEALKEIQRHYMKFDLDAQSKVVVFTDSLYVKENVNNAVYNWSPHWFGKDGQPIDNAPEWSELVTELKRLKKRGVRVEFEFAKGHNVLNPHNKRVDKLAKSAAKSAVPRELRPSSPGRKLTDTPTVRGSVRMEGQEIVIRVIGHQYNERTRTDSNRYEVVDAESPFNGCSDFIHSDDPLRRWRTYRVRVNDNTRNPRILEVIEEITEKEDENSNSHLVVGAESDSLG